MFEETELFARGIGTETDIVSKEMYTFDDRDGALADPAARGHRRHRARGHRAQPDEHGPRAEGLRDGAHVPARAAAEGPLPAVPPGGRGGVRDGAPLDRRRGDRDGAGVPARLRPRGARAGPELGGRRELPARLRGDAAPGAAGRSRRAVRGLPAARRRRTRCASSTARCPTTSRSSRRCRASPTTCARSAATTSRRCGASSTCSASRTASSHRLVRGLDYYTRTTFEVVSGALGAQNSRAGRRALRRPGARPGRARADRHRLRAGHGAAGDALPAGRGGAPLRRVPGAAGRRRAGRGARCCSTACARPGCAC